MALADSFTVTINGTTDNPVLDVDVGGSNVTLHVENRIEFGDTIAVSYAAPNTGKITDLFGNELADFTEIVVGNEILDPNDSDPPQVEDAETNARGNEVSISFDEDVVALIVPPIPINLMLLDSGADSGNQNRYYLEWSWSPGEGDESNRHEYYQYRYRQVTTPASNWSSYEITERPTIRVGNLLPNAQYELEVIATNIAGNSTAITLISDSEIVEAGKPPTGLSVENKGRRVNPDTSAFEYFMNVEYSKNVADTVPVTRYEYRIKKASVSAWGNWIDNALNLAFTLNIDANTLYDIEARSVNFIGASDEIAIQDQVVFTVPNNVDSLSIQTQRTGTTGSYDYEIGLSWDTPESDGSNTIDKIQYRHKENSVNTWGNWIDLDADATETTISGLKHTVGYDIELAASNNIGRSAKPVSETNIIIYQKPPAIPQFDGLVEEIDNMGTAENQIKWKWQLPKTIAGFNDIDDIQYRTRDTTENWGAFISFGNATTTQYILKNLTDGKTYEIQVKLLNSAGESSPTADDEQYNVLLDAPEFEINNLQNRVFQVVYFGPAEDSPVKHYQFQYQFVGENTWRPTVGTIIRAAPEFGNISVWNVDQANPQGIMIRWRGLDTDMEAITEWGQGTVPSVNQ